jgi:YHS domain-containing protein
VQLHQKIKDCGQIMPMKRRQFLLGLIAVQGSPFQRPKPEKARDPVCGIMVEKNPQLSSQYKAKTYYFCSNTDRDKFNRKPEEYAK